MLPNTAKPTRLHCRPLRAVRQSLVDVFGSDIQLWCRDDGWRSVPAELDVDELALAELGFAPPETAGVLNQLYGESTASPTASPTEPMPYELPDGTQGLVIPLPQRDRMATAATLPCSESSRSSLLRWARLFLKDMVQTLELERLRQEHQAFVQQVTHDFEELTFLRCMSRLLELSDLSFDHVAMAETMLATLRPLIDADTLLLVGSEAGATGSPDEPLCVAGMVDAVSFATCRRLVDHFKEVAGTKPIVKNHFAATRQAEDFPEVNSFILVPVTCTTAHLGWLLALNRVNAAQIAGDELPWGVSQREFGTHEATLMSSSASMLATHARNIELFRERECRLTDLIRSMVSRVTAGEIDDASRGERVARYARRFAEELGCPPESCERLYWAGLLQGMVTAEELESQERRVLSVVEAYEALSADGRGGETGSREVVEARLLSSVGPLDEPDWLDVFLRCLPDIEKIRSRLPPRQRSFPAVAGQSA